MNAVLAAFANAFILGAMLTLVVGALLRLLPKRTLNAATRYLVWWVTLALVIVSPLLYLAQTSSSSLDREAPALHELRPESPGVPQDERVQETRPKPPSADSSHVVVERPLAVTRQAPWSPFPVHLAAGVLPQLLLLTLLFSSGLMLARLAVSLLVLEQRKSRSVPASAALQAKVDGWLERCGGNREDVRLLTCSEISTPVAVGPRRPAILIPADLVDRLADWELDHVCLHEAAHLARRDDYALLFQRVIESVFVWNPLIRWISRHIELEREMACDDLVVSITGQPRDYAACLASLAELSGKTRRSLASTAATEQGKQLGRRVETLLDKSRRSGTSVLRLRAASLIAAQFAVVLWLAAMPGVVIFAEPVSQSAPGEIEQAIASHAIRLETVEAGHGFADLQPLKQVIGDARIVSLGEATHGTREFFQLKHRMLEFLVTEMDFTIFSIEANMPEAYRLNDFVLNGRGDPKQLLRGMYFWTWDTEEVLDMILWMREFNKSGKGRVEFTGFDMQFPDVALQNVDDFVARHDAQYLADLRQASSLAKSVAAQRVGSANFGVATATFPIERARGKRVRYSGYIKTSDIGRGWAGLWWRVDGKAGQMLAFDNMQDRGVKGTTDWQRYEIDLPVAADAVNINFGALHTGDGTAWFDGLAVELDGQPYLDKSEFDLDFESGTPAGFYTGGNGYQVFLDKQTFRRGVQSLQMRNVGGPAVTQKADEGPAARAAWKAVLSHLEQSGEDYARKGASSQEVKWTVQNARVVLQCLQMIGNEASRDESMAANVKWILDQAPDAKIVLWAHNGHVARGSLMGFQPMGSFLKTMYGDQMVVFGFAFNQGSFQAIKLGQGLQDFTVSPAPAGSLDATFAGAGIPVFALDARRPSTGSALSAWLSQPHKTRSIGASYSEDSSASFLSNLTVSDCFDVVLFVEKTTAARKNTVTQATIFTKSGGQEYRDAEMGVSVTLPADWSVQEAFRWGDRETTAWLGDGESKRFGALYFKIFVNPKEASPEAVRQRLRDEIEPKVAQRISQGMPDYHLDMQTCRERSIGGRVALSCRAQYTDKGQPMGEYLTWVGSENAVALFFGRAPAAGFDHFCSRFDVIIETLKIP